MKQIFLLHGFVLALLVLSCGRKAPVYHTWLSLNEMEYGAPVRHPPSDIPPEKFFPWAGIVSHHILAHDYIDAWFSRLAEARKPRCFYILSPSHYGISLEFYSLTAGSWESGFGPVESDSGKVRKLAKSLEVELDPMVFEIEHGVSVFMPYIKKYFPQAKVVAIAYEGEPPVNVPQSQRLAEVLASEFNQKGKRENFLLISADFSHHGSLETTNKRDSYSERYLTRADGVSWNMVFCDNRPGIFVLDRLGKNNLESHILYHTNSWEIARQGDDDITSYFFVYFGDCDPLY